MNPDLCQVLVFVWAWFPSLQALESMVTWSLTTHLARCWRSSGRTQMCLCNTVQVGEYLTPPLWRHRLNCFSIRNFHFYACKASPLPCHFLRCLIAVHNSLRWLNTAHPKYFHSDFVRLPRDHAAFCTHLDWVSLWQLVKIHDLALYWSRDARSGRFQSSRRLDESHQVCRPAITASPACITCNRLRRGETRATLSLNVKIVAVT